MACGSCRDRARPFGMPKDRRTPVPNLPPEVKPKAGEFVLQNSQGTQTFGSRLEAEAALKRLGGTLTRF